MRKPSHYVILSRLDKAASTLRRLRRLSLQNSTAQLRVDSLELCVQANQLLLDIGNILLKEIEDDKH